MTPWTPRFTNNAIKNHERVSQVKTILSVLLREYDIEMVGELPPANFEAMVVGPKGKCNVRYTKKTA